MAYSPQIRKTAVSVPELILIAGTRAILGAGIGLLLADRLSRDQRKAVGWTLFSIGAISTIPLGFEIFGERQFAKRTPEERLADFENRGTWFDESPSPRA